MTEPMPDSRARAARVALAVLAGALGTALLGAGLWMVFRPDPTPPVNRTIEPAEETTASANASSTPSSTTPNPSGAASPGATPPNAEEPASATKPEAKVAFRLGSSIYLANEDGSEARVVTVSRFGPYALSPDGRTLAVIETDALKLVDTRTRRVRKVGAADEGLPPCWQRDSKQVYFRRRTASGDAFEVWRSSRTGGTELVSKGQQAAVSPDGSILVVRDSDEPLPDGSSFVLVSVSGSPLKRVRVAGGIPTAVAAVQNQVLVALSSGDRGSAVVSVRPDGRGQKEIAGAVPGLTPAVWARMCPSPDGRTLALCAQGDDGFSRAFLVPSAGGELKPLSQRRDMYLHSWSGSGKRLFLIEGNAFQGESTALLSVKRDGTGRRVVVTGAE